MDKKLIRVGLSYPTIIDGKIHFSELPIGVPEVEVGMEYVTDTTDEEFLTFPEGKILLMEEKVQDAMCLRWCEIMRERYPLTEEQLNEIKQSSNT